ncbi:MAG TPA: chorismate mutase [Planctomycetaceae bacterium]|jgi:monofunctional chorismate mutase|nr:chorismate mutase [Planctomycetaceae bacterium]
MSQPWRVRGIRGATTASENTREAVLEATRELLQEVLRVNEITDPEDIASILFTTTPDLTATFPAEAAREIGLQLVPLLCASEIAVPGRLQKCVRVLLHVNTTKSLKDIVHVYLRDAKSLRPDIHSAQ